MAAKEHWTREAVEALRDWKKPRVRCRYECTLIDEDGNRSPDVRETTGSITVDGNNPWVVLCVGGLQVAERFSWGLVLDVLNDPFAAPIYFWDKYGIEYEV